jgi:hypothetical protein
MGCVGSNNSLTEEDQERHRQLQSWCVTHENCIRETKKNLKEYEKKVKQVRKLLDSVEKPRFWDCFKRGKNCKQGKLDSQARDILKEVKVVPRDDSRMEEEKLLSDCYSSDEEQFTTKHSVLEDEEVKEEVETNLGEKTEIRFQVPPPDVGRSTSPSPLRQPSEFKTLPSIDIAKSPSPVRRPLRLVVQEESQSGSVVTQGEKELCYDEDLKHEEELEVKNYSQNCREEDFEGHIADIPSDEREELDVLQEEVEDQLITSNKIEREQETSETRQDPKISIDVFFADITKEMVKSFRDYIQESLEIQLELGSVSNDAEKLAILTNRSSILVCLIRSSVNNSNIRNFVSDISKLHQVYEKIVPISMVRLDTPSTISRTKFSFAGIPALRKLFPDDPRLFLTFKEKNWHLEKVQQRYAKTNCK